MNNLTPESMLRKVESICKARSESARVASAAKDKSSSLQFFAIRVPLLKNILKDELSFLSCNSEVCNLRLWSYVIQNSNYYEPIALGLYYYQGKSSCAVSGLAHETVIWANRIENWGHCDLLAGITSNLVEINWADMRSTYLTWSNSDNPWLVRLSIVGLINNTGKRAVILPFKEVDFFLSKHLSSINPYVSRAVGWVLREYLKSTEHEIVFVYVEKHLKMLSMSAKQKINVELNLRRTK